MANDQTIYEFIKNSREIVRIQFSEFEGEDLLSIRVYYLDRSSDAWKPTRKGLAVRVEQLPEMKKGIDKAHDIWKERDSKPTPKDNEDANLPFDDDVSP